MHGTLVETRRGPIVIRPLRPGDTETVAAVLAQLGAESRRLRFGTGLPALEPLARVDGRRHVLVACARNEPIAIAHLAVDADPSIAEIAVAVADDWQDAGVGSALLRELTDLAAAAGITHIRAIVRLENRASLSLLRRLTGVVTRRIEGPELHVLATTT
jgi:ribosomal protein S18 acetylase RimI-like enzyme